MQTQNNYKLIDEKVFVNQFQTSNFKDRGDTFMSEIYQHYIYISIDINIIYFILPKIIQYYLCS